MGWIGLACASLTLGNVAGAQCTQTTAQLSEARSAHVFGASVGQWVLIAGGYRHSTGSTTATVDAYDACLDQWSALAFPSGVARNQGATTTLNDLAFFAGGLTGSSGSSTTDQIDIYDSSVGPPTDTNAWTTANLSVARRGLAATSIAGWAIFAGGRTSSPSAAVDLYEYATGTWYTGHALPSARYLLAATTVGPYAIFVGGQNDTAGTSTVTFYDSSTGLDPTDINAWGTDQMLSVQRYGLGAATVGTKAFIIGGLVDHSGPTTDVVEVYDSTIGPPNDPNAWSAPDNLSLGRHHPMVATVGQRIFVAGGVEGVSGPPTDIVDVYDDLSGQWSTACLSQARYGGGAGAACGQAVFGGGSVWSSSQWADGDVVDIFPDCDAWNYCDATANSTGVPASIGYTGTLSISTNDFTLTAADCPSRKPGLFFYGGECAYLPFGNGYLCVGAGAPAVFRLNPPVKTSASGSVSRLVDFTQSPACCGAGQITPGSTGYFQFWYRDVVGAGFNLTDGLRATFIP